MNVRAVIVSVLLKGGGDADRLRRAEAKVLQTDEEFRQLATQHHDLDERIHNLATRHYLSEPEQIEEVTLKKRKLQLKDQMETILRRHSAGGASRRTRRALSSTRRTSSLHRASDRASRCTPGLWPSVVSDGILPS